MVVCKYFQQGTCRYGQYCRFQHINSFGGNQANSNKQFTEGSKNIVLGVAEEVLAAERGGQWLLSCFGPLKEQPCIPGMEDVSPEEVRWEMYQAQKNGTVDQTKLQFQQLCQAMTAKREALKNPTHETVAMLDKLQKSNRDSTFGGKTNFALSTPQMSQPSNTATSSSVFGAKTFGAASNPFGGSFAASGAATSSIFGRAATTGASVFGAKPSFGGNAMFGSGQPNANTVFGGAAMKGAATVFGGGNQNMQSFAAATSTPGSVFGGSGNFGTTQASSPFSMAQPAQSTTSVFGTTTTAAPTNSLFGGSSSTLFGAAAPATNLFGAAASAQTANPFGAQPATPASSTIGSTSIFGAAKNTAAFGGAPVFGAAGGFGAAPGASVFGAQATFDNSQMPASSVFGGTSAQSATFGANAQTTNSFGALASPQAATSPFGAVVSAANATPFGAPAGPFGSTAANSPFARAAPFTGAMQPGNEEASPFAAAAAGAGAGFGALAPPVSQPFGAPAFGTAPSTPFASTTSTTTTSNPFAPRSQQQVNTPFGVAQTTMSSAGPFGSPFGTATAASIVDEAFYTIEGKLTDDEKSSYMADKFAFGKIPLDPPTIELR